MNEQIIRTDPRIQRSRASIIAALVELVEDMPPGQLSITRVVEAAGVTRPTFYQHFPDVITAAQSAAFERLDAAFPKPEDMLPAGPLSDADLHARIVAQAMPVLQHLAEHLPFYQRVLASAIGAEFFDRLVSFVASRILPEVWNAAGRPGQFQQDLTTVIAAGMTWLVVRWVANAELQPTRVAAFARRAADVAVSLRPGPA